MKKEHYKKQEEIDFFIEFRNAVDFDFEIIENNRESPDFIICYDNQNIGIEMTKYYNDINEKDSRGSILKGIENEKSKTINSALKYYSKNVNNRPLRVLINFVPGLKLKRNNREEIARILCDCLSNLQINKYDVIDVITDSYHNLLSKYFSSIHVTGLPFDKKDCWTSINWGIVNVSPEENISIRIRDKEEKIEEYRKVTNRNWLLIVSDGRNPSSMISVGDNFNYKVKSKFDKVYFLRYPETRVYELQ